MHPRSPLSYRELIALELASCIQKLAYQRGHGMTSRSFPASERDTIESFGLACCRLGADGMDARVDVARARMDAANANASAGTGEDTAPGWKHSEKPSAIEAPADKTPADTKDTKP